MDKEKRFQMLKLNSSEQNDLVLYDLLREGKIDKFKQLIKNGYALDAFVLNSMVDNGFEGKIDDIVEMSHRWNENVFNFLVLFWGQEKAEDYWFEHAESELAVKKLSNEGLVRHKQWQALFARKAYAEVAKNAPLDVLKTAVFGKKDILSVLIAENRFDDILALDWKDCYGDFPLLLKYILKHDLQLFLSIPSVDKHLQKLGFKTFYDYWRYLYEHGEKDYLVKNTNYFEKFGTPEELKHYGMYFELAEIGRYDLIDWDDFAKKRSVNGACICAEKAKNWDFLLKHKQHWRLLKHFRLWRFMIRT